MISASAKCFKGEIMKLLCALMFCVLVLASFSNAAEETSAWPSPVLNFQAPTAGEHPRLLFRKADVAELKKRAATPEGQAILKRLRVLLNGSDGETMPTKFNAIGSAYAGNENNPVGTYSMSHAAGYGLLYQLTGDKKYAEFGKQCFEKAFEGVRDRDGQGRYSFRKPGGALRCGPTLGWYALGYDLCYDGWDPAFRERVAAEFSKYDGRDAAGKDKLDPNLTIESCILGKRQHPGSNHWGMEVGGAALAMLAILNDPGVDMKKFGPLFEQSQKVMIRNMTEGFGDGGFFPEGDGTGSMSSHIVFLTALQAWKNAAGKDFITPRPNAQWMANKWFLLTRSQDGKPDFQPQRGAYPHNIWTRDGLSGGGYFSIGMGVAASEDIKAALLWYYTHGGYASLDAKNDTPCDTPSPYPHHAVLAFVNWPIGTPEKSPNDVLPHAVHDSKWGFYAWRNRWEDANDVIISILTKGTKGNYACKAETALSINNGGKKMTWGNFKGGFTGDFKPAKDGSTVLTTADGSCLAIDFSGTSGSSVLLIASGIAAPSGGDTVEVNGKRVALLFLGKGTAEKPVVRENQIAIGRQTIICDGTRLTLDK